MPPFDMASSGLWGISDPNHQEVTIDWVLSEAESMLNAPRHRNIKRENQVARFLMLMSEAERNNVAYKALRETLTTSDFPIIFGDAVDRVMLGKYAEWPSVWRQYAKTGTLKDFRAVKRIYLNGMGGRWYPSFHKAEMEAVRYDDNIAEGQYTYSVDVYEKGWALNWRMIVNDDLGAFNDLPTEVASGARKSQDFFVTTLHADANGPHASFYTTNLMTQANGAASNNPTLTAQSLIDAKDFLSRRVDPKTGEPILITHTILVVPPALEMTANAILHANSWNLGGFGQSALGATGGIQMQTANFLSGKMTLVVNPYLPIVTTTGSVGHTAWYLFADPNTSRPALEVGTLRGFEEPRMYQKAPDMMRLGGGLEPQMGDFETGEQRYKGMMVIGGTRMDPLSTVASKGTGAP